MANLPGLAKDTAIYGMSSFVGRFLNYLLVPLYTNYMPKESGDYGVSVNIYAYTALVLVILTFGMETTLFRFANKEDETPDTVFSTAMGVVGTLSADGNCCGARFHSGDAVQLFAIPEATHQICFAEDAVHLLQHRVERPLFCGLRQDRGLLCLLHQSLVYRSYHVLFHPRLLQGEMAV